MINLNYETTKRYHQDLIQHASNARLARQACESMLTFKDKMCLRLGDFMILVGTRIKNMSSFPKKSAFTELSRECQ
jgi:hypothetical protein